MQVREIVVAVELSDADRSSIVHAASLAGPLGARITLLNVDEVSGYGFRTSAGFETYLANVETRRQRRLEDAQRGLDWSGIEVNAATAIGDAAEEIAKFASARGAQLVVIGRRGAREPSRTILGHTAKRLLRRCQVPLLVTEGGSSPPPLSQRISYQRLLAATDFSEPSELGLRATATLAEQLDAQVDYVHVIRLPVAIPAVPSEPPLLVPRESSEELRRAQAEELGAAVARLGSSRCTPSVVLGMSVAETLAETAKSLGDNLIVVPSHGHSRLRETLFGSTAEHVVKIAPVPVLVLPAVWLKQTFSPAPSP